MSSTASMLGSGTVVSIGECPYLQGVVVQVESGSLLSPRACELRCAVNGAPYDIQFSCRDRDDSDGADLSVVRRSIRVRHLAVGDVVTWDHSRDVGRVEVHGYPLGNFVDLARHLDDDEIYFPESISIRLGEVERWAMSPWFDWTDVDPAPGFSAGLHSTFRPVHVKSPRLASSIYLHALRRVLDYGRRHAPSAHSDVATTSRAESKLSRRQREIALPIAQQLESRTLRTLRPEAARR